MSTNAKGWLYFAAIVLAVGFVGHLETMSC